LSAIALCLGGCASPRSAIRYSPPSVAPVREQISEAGSHVTNAQTHAQAAKRAVAAAVSAANKYKDAELNLQLVAADHEIDALTVELNSAQTALRSANTNVDSLEHKIGDQTNLLNTANDEKNAALTKAHAAARRYHKLKFWVCALAAAATALLIFRFKALLFLIPPPYNFIVGAAVPAGVFGFLWLRL